MDVATLNYVVALGAIALQVVTVALLVLYIARRGDVVSTFVARRGTVIVLLVSSAATALTLFYSEVIGFPPCPLCWWQRIFMFPQVVLAGVAIRKKEHVADYSIALSIIGLGVALYHHALQMFPAGSLPCPAQGEVSCAQVLLLEFGYVTFPMLAATLFAFLIVVMLFVRRRV